MKIAIAQLQPLVGQVESNLDKHLILARLAADKKSDLIVFPELSITAYVTHSAKTLGRPLDRWLKILFSLQQLSDDTGLTIVIGAPIKASESLHISSIHFHPHAPATVQHKRFLHEDEVPFFDSGHPESVLVARDPNVALAICYELSAPGHLEKALSEKATVYVASVANHVRGVEKASRRLSSVAREHQMITLMSNCIGEHEGNPLVGRSAVWGRDGRVLAELDDKNEGLIQVDCETSQATLIRRL